MTALLGVMGFALLCLAFYAWVQWDKREWNRRVFVQHAEYIGLRRKPGERFEAFRERARMLIFDPPRAGSVPPDAARAMTDEELAPFRPVQVTDAQWAEYLDTQRRRRS